MKWLKGLVPFYCSDYQIFSDSDSKCIDQLQMETVEKLPKTAHTTSKKVFQCRACKLVFFDTKSANVHILGKKHQQKVKPDQTKTAKTRLYGRG